MEQITQYQRLAKIKPAYYKTEIPYHKPTMKRIKFNLKETELYFDESNGIYSEEPAKKTGGSDSGKTRIILVDANSIL
jgi:hypothetical protein